MLENRTLSEESILYHYTSLEAFRQIITNRKVWATNSKYLNDTTEFQYGIDLAKEVYGELGSSHKSTYFTEDFIGSSELSSIYIFSLSNKKDLLSQWRAYCPDGGVSIGLNKHVLEIFAEQQRCELVECIYDRQEQKRRLLEFIEGQGQPNYQEFLKVLATFKHPAFAEEEEYRLISKEIGAQSLYYENLPYKPYRWRTTNTMFIKYVEFAIYDLDVTELAEIYPDLSEEERREKCFSSKVPMGEYGDGSLPYGSVPYREIIAGPSIHQQLAKNAISEFIEENIRYEGLKTRGGTKPKKIRVESSTIPYRSK